MATITLNGITDENTLKEYNRRKAEFKKNSVRAANNLDALAQLETTFMAWLTSQDAKFGTYYTESVAEISGLQDEFDLMRTQAADFVATVRRVQLLDSDFPQQPTEATE